MFDDEKVGLSLYTLVWNPGQWTPVHDHGTWGVVGIIEGRLDEQSYLRVDPGQANDQANVQASGQASGQDDNIDLQRSSLVLLSPGQYRPLFLIRTIFTEPDVQRMGHGVLVCIYMAER